VNRVVNKTKEVAFRTVMLTILIDGILKLAFNVQSVRATGTIYIKANGSVVPSTAPIQNIGN